MQTWQHPTRKVILASGSPRRRELLSAMGFSFEVIPGGQLEENAFIDPGDLSGSLGRLAVAKAMGVAVHYPAAAVLSADTIVVCNNRVLGKPAGRADARRMLEALSGRLHTVMTGVALTCREIGFCQSAVAVTGVHFRNLAPDEIEWYLDSGEPFDKAGAYGIQGKAMIFVDKIEGCFYNVVGLPVKGTIDLFKAFTARKEPRNAANE
ncbi:MAG: septum formation protein Maf [Chitinispirillaceae bacterium]|nr:septum formation protein Maf [Chitinispirillaceae bacterium]